MISNGSIDIIWYRGMPTLKFGGKVWSTKWLILVGRPLKNVVDYKELKGKDFYFHFPKIKGKNFFFIFRKFNKLS